MQVLLCQENSFRVLPQVADKVILLLENEEADFSIEKDAKKTL